MPAYVRCGRRMDGSGPGRIFSSPNRKPAELIEQVFSGRAGEDERLPLPPGHPVSWGLLTQGTVLEGAAYVGCL
jgi:hypothetical protein